MTVKPPRTEALAPTVRDRPGDTDPVPEEQRERGEPPAARGRYESMREIARGGMGRVVEATDHVLGRAVAVKEALASDGDALRRFARETRITARLEHPSIVPVYDAGTTADGQPYYVMRKVSGRPLDRLVDDAEQLDQRLALVPHVVAAAQAVAHAHGRGIIHRDLKPANILVGDHGETVVIDWGLAKVIGETDPDSAGPEPDPGGSLRTRVGAVFGTPGFMSPEQLQSSAVDERADVYALGATLYYVLARRPPHLAGTSDAMMAAAIKGPPVPIAQLVPGVPSELSAIVDKALAYDDRVRYRTAGALADDLQRFLTGQLVAAHRYSAGERLARFVRRYRGVVIAVAIALVALAIGAWVAVGRVLEARDTAMTEMHAAQAAHDREAERADELVLSQARAILATNPTRAVALVRPLAGGSHWREVRGILAAARAAGVAWRYPASKQTSELDVSPGGALAASAGTDGKIRVYDLAHHTTREVRDAGGRARIAFTDDTHLAVATDAALAIVDLTGGAVRDVPLDGAITGVVAAAGIVYGRYRDGRAWRLGPTDAAPVEYKLADPIAHLAVAPDGKRVALGGVAHLWVVEDARDPVSVADGKVFAVQFAADEAALIALVGKQQIVLRWPGPVRTVEPGALQIGVALARGVAYSAGLAGIRIAGERAKIRDTDASMMGFAIARDGLAVTAKDATIEIFDGDEPYAITSPLAPLELIAASAHGHHVVALAHGAILAWDLDDVVPRRFALPSSVMVSPIADHVLVAVRPSQRSLVLDLAQRTTVEGLALPLAGFALTPTGKTTLVRYLTGGVFRLRDGVLEQLADGASVAAPIDDARVVIGTERGELRLLDLATRRTTALATRSAKITRIETATHWVVAISADRIATRIDVDTRALTTLTLAANTVITDAAADGTVWLAEGARLRRWRPDGMLIDQLTLPEPAVNLVRATDRRILALAADGTSYVVSLDTPERFTSGVPLLGPLDRSLGDLAVVTGDRGGIGVVDLATGDAWQMAPTVERSATARITPDAAFVYVIAGDALLAWPLAVARDPAATVRAADTLTDAVLDPTSLALSWPQ